MARKRSASIGVMIVRDPLTPVLTIEGGATPPYQQKTDDGHDPDWSVAPLVLRPVLSAIDPDGELGGQTPAFETGSKWEVFIDGVPEVLTSGGTDTRYELDTSDYTLKWKKNLDPGQTVIFRMTWVFTAGVQNYRLAGTFTARCAPSTRKVPRLELDKPLTQKYCFCREDGDIIIEARLTGGDKNFQSKGQDPDCAFLWFRKDAGSDWRRIYPKGDSRRRLMDYDLEILDAEDGDDDTSRLLVHREMMGEGVSIMCRAWYMEDGVIFGGGIAENSSYTADADGDTFLTPGAPVGDSPAAYYATERYLGKTEEKMLKVRSTYSDPNTMLKPEAYMEDQKGEVTDLERHFRIGWYAVGSSTETFLASGKTPEIAAKDAAGKLLTFRLEERGCLKAATYNGKVLTYGGKILLTN